MKVVILTALILGPLYYLNRDSKMAVPLFRDEVVVKSAAPKRPVIEKKVVKKAKSIKTASNKSFFVPPSVGSEENDDEHFDEFSENTESEHGRAPALNDLEAAWQASLLEFLTRLEPVDAQRIQEMYIGQQDAYQAEFEAIMAEKQQKVSDTEAFETEDSLAKLDYAHEKKLQEILGAHYEAVRDFYEEYMDSVEVEEPHY